MAPRSRREFLADVGCGMVVAGIGSATAFDLGLAPAWAKEGDVDAISFGPREPLIRLMQDTNADKLLPLIVERWKQGTSLEEIVACAALGNVRTFAGEDYVGLHTMMALTPALKMAREMPTALSLLPILKVLHRNSTRIEEHGGHASEKMQPVAVDATLTSVPTTDQLHQAVLNKDKAQAEQFFARMAQHSPETAFNSILEVVQDNTEVHRVVMPYKAWELLDVVGREHAHSLLRQSVRYCVKAEMNTHNEYARGGSRLLPKLFDEYKLLSKPFGTSPADDAWVEHLAKSIFQGTPDEAAAAVAAALTEGFAPDAVGEAVTLAANQLILRDKGRPKSQAQATKPEGSVHGDSIGVHGCDSANAWRNMARVANPRNVAACLILGAWQVAFDRTSRGGDFLAWQPWPLSEHTETLKSAAGQLSANDVLKTLDNAIKANDQALASAAAAAYAERDANPAAIFSLLRGYAISEDGALHAEKFYRTVSQEFAEGRAAFRWRHVIGLSRVTASEFGRPAPGIAIARELLHG